MSASFPVPIQFALPSEHWTPVDPRRCGLDDAVAVALRSGSATEDYVPVLTIRGSYRTDRASLEETADAALEDVRDRGVAATVIKRTSIESAQVPAVVQLLEIDAIIEGRRYDLCQAHAIEALMDAARPPNRFVLSFAMTCRYGQLSEVGPEFERFMGSVALG